MVKKLLEIDGIGPKTAVLFEKLGIYNVNDLLYYYPKRYDVLKRTDMRYIKNLEKVILDGVVEGSPTLVSVASNLKKIMFRLSNSYNVYNIGVFNQIYLCRELKVGMKVIVIGKYNKLRNEIIANEVRVGELSDEVKIEPIYATTDGLNRKLICRVIKQLLLSNINIDDYIPDYLRDKYHFKDKLWAISQIHYPVDGFSFKKAKQRLKYEELFLYLLKIQYLKDNRMKGLNAIERVFDERKLDEFIKTLPFSLTVDQKKVLDEIKRDLVSLKRMNRLIQGDVGSGKTIVAFLAAYMNFLAGYQTALMVPTEILAVQHYNNAISLFRGTDMKVVLLTSSITNKMRDKILKQIKSGEVSFIIGTQSLIQERVVFENLGLVIADEQHRFGVNQRNELRNKGIFPDILSMSATPIPRTYALTIYGDMDVSNIRTKPAGRKEIITYCKKNDEIMDVLKMMKKEIDLGHQIYVIAPSIEGNESSDLDTVSILKDKMILAFGKICRIGIVHGKLDNVEKNKTMRDFENGEIQILVSTTVIEVGVNVPNASMIVIFKANLFGLSTLHQLRGRVGRGDIQSYCILISKENCERLEILEKSNDGFEISEYDFKYRGEGDLFGVRQSGDAEFRLANIKKDFDLLLRVRDDVLEFFSKYYCLEKYLYIKEYLENLENFD